MSEPSKKIIIALTLLAGLFAFAGLALAQGADLGLSYGNATGLVATDPRLIVGNIIRIALGFLGVIAIGLIIYGGFLWMTASGDEEKITTAKKVLVSAVIGLLIILSAFAIATFILNSILNATGVSTTGTTTGGGGSILPGTGGAGQPCGGTAALGACGGVCDVGSCDMSTCLCPTAGGTGTSCNGATTPGVCEDNGACDSTHFCDPNAADPCTCQPQANDGGPCDVNSAPGCQAIDNCYNNSACDFGTCQCAPSVGVGAPCNATTTAGVCRPDSNLCSNNLTCETTGAKACTCEEYPVIDWVSPVGGFCDSDHNKICTKDTDCPGSTCDTAAPNGAVGNIISLGGQYFGDATGTVEFSNGAGGFVAGDLPKTANRNCVSSWAANQIIIVVPVGAKDGPIRVTTIDDKTDLTNDSRGPKIKDFVVNSITRPGLCQVTPEGKLGSSVFYNGVNFSSAAAADFGSYGASIMGVNSAFGSNAGSAIVPNFNPGQTTTFVYNSDSQQNSNYLAFTNSSTPALGAFISSFEPVTGNIGQYVTIRGNGFGNIQGKSQVYFGTVTNGTLADLDFPPVCKDSTWSDQQIIVKVPVSTDPKFSNFNDILTVKLENGQTLTSAGATPQSFKVDTSLPLKPSLCKISPVIGVVGTQVNLWGEYFSTFDESNSLVRFFHNQPVSGAAKLTWDGDNTPNTITTAVPSSAATGPVTVVKNASSPANALEGNGLNFSVGSCLDAPKQDTACGADEHCCGADTAKAGTCVANLTTDCSATASTSVYEFKFSTNVTPIASPTAPGSCEEISNATGACTLGLTCPNVPGECSPLTGSPVLQPFSPTVNCDDSHCQDQPGCDSGTCVYSSQLNRCVENTGGHSEVCDLASTTVDDLGNSHDTYCGAYKDVSNNLFYYYMYKAGPRCSAKFNLRGIDVQGIPVCVDTATPCSICLNAKQDCLADPSQPASHQGVCGSASEVCAGGSTCVSGQCEKAPGNTCPCCCQKANANQDCCAPLKCEGTCGSDVGKANPTTYGSCGGCKKLFSSGPNAGQVDVAGSDAACSCAAHTGQFCDTSDTTNFPDGVCRDCAAMSDAASCRDHSGACCVDRQSGNCKNLSYDNTLGDILPIVNYQGSTFCGYFQCGDNAAGCSTPTSLPASPFFPSSAECNDKCGSSNSLLGVSCQNQNQPDTCNLGICSGPFSCLLDNGAKAPDKPAAAGCGFCCCDPTKIGADKTDASTYDACHDLGLNSALSCRKNQTPCSGDSRGLCCGCQGNDSCVPPGATPDYQGCGMDSCCRARPSVSTITPDNGVTNVCTNADLGVSFNQKMDTGSFNDDFILIEEVAGDAKCASGTTQIGTANVSLQNKNIFEKTYDKLLADAREHLTWLFGKQSLANVPDNSHLYCSVPGNVSSAEEGDNKTILNFQPSIVLEPDTVYYAVVRGVHDLSTTTGAVLSYWDIGLNVFGSASPVANYSQFDGVAFTNSYLWWFKTKQASGEDDGICGIDHVSISPDSYLINHSNSDLNENDNDPTSKTFDTAADNDKAFTAAALSADDQVLHPVKGYSWTWSWQNGNTLAVNFVNNNNNGIIQPFDYVAPEQLVRAVAGVVDAQAQLLAKVYLTDTRTFTDVNQSVPNPNASSTADVYVFMCSSTWPDNLQSQGIPWRPWFDTLDAVLGGGCVKSPTNPLNSVCNPMNYELYYCRDNGGSAADLPTVTNPVTSLGSNLDCTDTNAPGTCTGLPVGAACGAGGTCQDLLKESYFFGKNIVCSDPAAAKNACNGKAAGSSCGTNGTCQSQ